MSGCYVGCYYYTDSCFRKDCKMNQDKEQLKEQVHIALAMFSPYQKGVSLQGLSKKKFIGSGEDVVLEEVFHEMGSNQKE